MNLKELSRSVDKAYLELQNQIENLYFNLMLICRNAGMHESVIDNIRYIFSIFMDKIYTQRNIMFEAFVELRDEKR